MITNVELECDITGRITRLVAGDTDLTTLAHGVSLFCSPGEITQLQVVVKSGISLGGEMDVLVMQPEEAFLEKLSRIDGREVQEEALKRMEWGGDEDLASTILQVIKERLLA